LGINVAGTDFLSYNEEIMINNFERAGTYDF